MEEQNKNIENQQPENENNETNIQTKKPVPKKTIIIASIIAAITILATVMCVIIFGGGEKQEIIGEWRNAYNANEYIKFFKNRTGEFQAEGGKFNFDWIYDSEKDEYTTTIAGKDFAFKLRTEEGITFLTGYGYLFRLEDCETAMAAAPRLRDNRINKELEGKTLLTIGTEISTDKANIIFNDIKLSEDKKSILANISVTAKDNITESELNELLMEIKHSYFDCYLDLLKLWTSSPLGSNGIPIEISNKNLSVGETLNAEIEIFDDYLIPKSIETFGMYCGCLVLKCGDNIYFVDLREYTKQ